jgi:hypothetical protein
MKVELDKFQRCWKEECDVIDRSRKMACLVRSESVFVELRLLMEVECEDVN